jgi:hypothetical protein
MQMAEFADIDFVFDATSAGEHVKNDAALRGIVFDVLPGAGGVEDEVDIGKLRHLHQAAHPFVGEAGDPRHRPDAGGDWPILRAGRQPRGQPPPGQRY